MQEARKSQATVSVESDQPDAGAIEYRARDLARQWRRPGLDGPSLASPDSGFAELGDSKAVGEGPGSAAGPPGMEHSTSQLLSYRTFWPGQSYTPDVSPTPHPMHTRLHARRTHRWPPLEQ